MSSVILFHGPGARQAAVDEASQQGRLVAPPFGDEGLKTDEAREVVELLYSTPIGDDPGVLVVGPMDEANPKASDVLLKVLEEGDLRVAIPILWANDLGAVSPTIRSRCLHRWVNGSAAEEDEDLEFGVRELLDASFRDEVARMPPALTKLKGKEKKVAAVAAEVLASMLDDPKALVLWERVRKLAMKRNPVPMEILATFLPGGS